MRNIAPEGYTRINKRIASYYFNAGYTIYVLPSNMPFENRWFCPLEVNNKLYKENFRVIIEDYKNFNCTNKEVGLYPAFYIKMKGVNLYGFIKKS